MTKKQVLLFLVEGPSDQTSLETVLNRIFSSDLVAFHVIHTDILTKDFVSATRIAAKVCDEVKVFLNKNHLQKGDVCRVVHLIDTDGAYIPESAVQAAEGEDTQQQKYPIYTESEIITNNRHGIIDRNRRKAQNIDRLSTISSVYSSIPYSIYYFSCNLEHVLHNQNNLSDEEKTQFAYKFDLKYADRPNDFISFMKDSSFAVPGSYGETWSFIKKDCNSLKRYSNFYIGLPDRCDWNPSEASNK